MRQNTSWLCGPDRSTGVELTSIRRQQEYPPTRPPNRALPRPRPSTQVVTILAGLATFERHLIKARTEDGRKRAKERGVRFGRPPKLTAFQRQEAVARLQNGESQADVAQAYNVDPAASAGCDALS
jgi:DNA invertase Pin-like site-specific DNA recombinase